MKIGLIIVGDEILSGKRQDKHFSKVLEMLTERGLALSWVQYLGDDRQRLTDTLRLSFAGPDLVFSCGGIGATPDDHTRQSAAAALGEPLKLHPQAERLISERCARMASEGNGSADMATRENQQRLQMGVFPQSAQIIENPYNQIPGFSVGHHHFFPGFPVMAWPMIASVLDSRYGDLFGQDAMEERAFWVYTLPESAITPLMEQILANHPGVGVFSLPSANAVSSRRHIELGVKGPAALIGSAFADLRLGIQQLGGDIS
ncbi:MAG: molybdopterin-binding protein, partial [Burkholderiaceae bacterium]